jgi:hypothetical protein
MSSLITSAGSQQIRVTHAITTVTLLLTVKSADFGSGTACYICEIARKPE